ncbi:MAG: TonB-dependent receptor plug domain-containing protein [Alphaproteobacteria bacterium]|nr:TonB-dependent receptor plug domain-containing protein [Alphaproteobacteria bacterium]
MLRQSTTKLICLTAIALVLPEATPSATAQQLEEIIVTSRQREESLLDIPLTVTAFSAQDIEVKALDELTDIVDFSPGFFYSEHSVGKSAREFRRLVFRGMQPRTDIQTRQSATVFIDGAPILGAEIGSTEDYERIEVIKGPQSAYFGRSTFAGAINAITKTPGDEFKGRVNAEYGRFGTADFGVSLEGPIVQDKLAVRVSGSFFETDGQYTNAANPTNKLGERSTVSGGATLYFTPTDNFSAKARFRMWNDSDGPDAGTAYGSDNAPASFFNCNPGGSVFGSPIDWICGTVPETTPDLIAMDLVVTQDVADMISGASATVPYILSDKTIPDGFGLERNALETSLVMDWVTDSDITLSSLTAFHKDHFSSVNDLDRRATEGLTGGLLGFPSSATAYDLRMSRLSDFSQEFRVTSADDQKLRWIAGGTYSERNYKAQTPTLAAGLRLGGFNDPGDFFEAKTSAVFGAAAYDINDWATLSVEARYQWDKINEGDIGGNELSETFKAFTPRVILDLKPTEDTTVYLNYARGTNPGRFNPALVGRTADELSQIAAQTGADTSVPEETLDNFEVGLKGNLMDGRAFYSVAAYYSKWRNVQIPNLVTITNAQGDLEIIGNVTAGGGKADLKGLEFEGSIAATENLTLDATFAWNNTDIKEFESPDATALLGNPTITGLGNEFSRTPEFSGSASASYFQTINENWDWFLRGDYIFRGSTWATNANITETGDAHRINLRAGIESSDLRLEAYVTNVTNDKTPSSLQALFDLSGISGFIGARVLAVGLPDRRAFGVRSSYSF